MKSKSPMDLELRKDWKVLSMHAWTFVTTRGGPRVAGFEVVLQIWVRVWMGAHEAWTVYRASAGENALGKVEFRRWNRKADEERIRQTADGGSNEKLEPTIDSWEFAPPYSWIASIEARLRTIVVPLISNSSYEKFDDVAYDLDVCHRGVRSHFTWHKTPPSGWQPLAELFFELLHDLRSRLPKTFAQD